MRPRRPHPMTPELALGLRVRAIRERHGWTQERLAKQAGLSLGFVGRIEIGYHDPRMSTLVRLAAALQVKPGRLLE